MKKMTPLELEHFKLWKYPERSCNECKNYPCFSGQENMKADYAKYGCFSYSEKET